MEIPTQAPFEFYAFLFLWSSLWIITKIRSPAGDKNHFGENLFLITGNHVVGMTFATLSLYFDDETKFRESILLSWYASYFVVDLLDCIYRGDVVFSIHAVLSLALSRINYLPKYYFLRTGSKGAFTELSSFFLSKWKKSKKKIDFQIFTVVFFFCRLVWVPVFMVGAAKVVDIDGFVIYATVAFYLLQLLFFGKMVVILFNYKEGKKSKEE